MIKDFVLNDSVTAFLTVRRRDIKEYNNTTYISFEFGDASGRIAGVWWEPDRYAVDELQEGDVVKVKAAVGEYRGKQQLRVAKLRAAKPDEFQLSDILPHSRYADEELRAKIRSLTDRVENSYVKSLMLSFWEDTTFFDAYIKAAAGKLWHHSFVGGLAEHSINVTELCLDLSNRYGFLDRDLLIFGGLFHDMGKVDQYRITSFIDYSDEGRLVGHINLADSLITEHAGHITDFPSRLLIKLRHMILSHHGHVEYASPVVPQIPEAFILYYADEIDSKMGAIDRIREKTGSGWSEYVKLLDRMLYFDGEET
ncbi:MAG: HD domain-containing protein [candidate division Zixibacteria bacterium]|nr:HD domain-containing protein [candidate division Zixibacteria bacterium]